MNRQDENEMTATGPDSRNERRDDRQNPDVNQSPDRPYGDAGNLYEIPRVRSDDPPMRKWWTDDEPQNTSGSRQ